MIVIDLERAKKAVKEILYAIGEDPEREGLVDTPERVANMYAEIFSGLSRDPYEDIKIFRESCSDEMVLVKDIPLYSMCEHHLLPFIGVAHVVYIPKKGEILGLSKIARTVDTFSKKPQLQERLCSEIADFLVKATGSPGVAVIIEAEHLCMTMRGIRKPGAKTLTSALRGTFKTDAKTRSEAMTLIFGSHG